MTTLYEFSDKSVELAKAADLLGFDVIRKVEYPILQGKHSRIKVFMANAHVEVELNKDFFPELLPDTNISIHYIIGHKDVNRMYHDQNIPHVLKKFEEKEDKE